MEIDNFCKCLLYQNLYIFRVMVLDAGQIKEYDTPKTLLEDKKTIFHSMARDAGLVWDCKELISNLSKHPTAWHDVPA